ncbi:MAG TPA: NADP-dependent oxidoreductase, partial [Chloroflexota bacterium]|nr:NADP-dependent oxidoreductase [Chloroflexota bacterium]
MANETMRAIRYHETGEADVLRLEEVPRPTPGEGEVLVRLHAAGINPVDSTIRRGVYFSGPLPAVPGFDLAGTVEAVGPGVSQFQPSQVVFGIGRGTYAEYSIATPDLLALKPANLSFDEAASIPLAARTAWGGLFNLGDLQPGQRVLVHAAAGGVGV